MHGRRAPGRVRSSGAALGNTFRRTRHGGSIRPMSAARVSALIAAVVTFIVYAATAARSITWWDGSQYPWAAWTLGIAGAPGSLLLTLLGATLRLFVRPEAFAFALNLLAAGLAAATAAIIAWVGCRFAKREGQPAGAPEA